MKKNAINKLESFYEEKYSSGKEFIRSSKLFTLSLVPRNPSLKILDAGCGTGINSSYLVQIGHRVIGVDISYKAIEQYNAKGYQGYVMDLRKKLDFPDEYFDLIFASEVIEHIDFPSYTLREFRRILNKNGMLILSTPNSAFWVYRILGCLGYPISELQHPHHLRFFSVRSLKKLLEENGFKIKCILGRNMYILIGDRFGDLFNPILKKINFQREIRFRTGKFFWHFSKLSTHGLNFWSDTLIVKAVKDNL